MSLCSLAGNLLFCDIIGFFEPSCLVLFFKAGFIVEVIYVEKAEHCASEGNA